MNKKQGLTDTEYLDGLRCDDPEILESFLEKIFAASLEILQTGNTDDENATTYSETALLRMMKMAKEDKLQPGNLVGYASQIIRHLRDADYRKKNRQPLEELHDHEVKDLSDSRMAEEALKNKEEIEEILEWLEEWDNEKCKALLTKNILDKVPLSQLCLQMGRTHDGIRQKKGDCLKAFRKFVELKRLQQSYLENGKDKFI